MQIFLSGAAVDNDTASAFEEADSSYCGLPSPSSKKLLSSDSTRHGRFYEGFEGFTVLLEDGRRGLDFGDGELKGEGRQGARFAGDSEAGKGKVNGGQRRTR